MKVLFFSPAGSVYGSERSLLTLLKARDFEAEVACPGGGALEHELSKLKIQVHELEFNRYSLRQNPFWHLKLFLRLHAVLRSVKPDVVVINLDGNTPLVTIAAVTKKIPIVRFCRFEYHPPTRWIDRWSLLKARSIICPSELVKQQILAWAPPYFHDRAHRIYEACSVCQVRPEDSSVFRQQYGLGDSHLISYVGRLHRDKRIDVAIKSLAILRRQLGDVRLLIIGEHDGSLSGEVYQEELSRLADELDVKDAVTFTGYIPEDCLPIVISASRAIVLPSESESFGMVLMEAWAQGVPTVASDVGGCREITLASGGGMLAPVGDAEAFAAKLFNMLTHADTAYSLGQSGKTWVSKNCSIASYASQFNSILIKSRSANDD